MSLQVWLPLNGNLDNQGLTNSTITSYGGPTINNNGKIGKCYSFDGVDDYLSLGGLNFGGLSRFSVAFWCKPTNTSLINGFQIKAAGGAVAFQLDESNGFCFRDSTHSNLTSVSFNTPVAGEWAHYAFVYDNGNWRIYKNGIKDGDGFTASQIATFLPSSTTFYLCSRRITAGNYYFNGCINDFRIYDNALSTQEVAKLAQGLILHYPLNNNGFGQENLFSLDTVISGSTKTIVTIVNNVINVKSSQINYGAFSQSSNSRITFEAGTTYMLSGHIKSITKGEDNYTPRLSIRDSSHTIKASVAVSGNESNVFKTYTPTETFSGYICGLVTFSSGSSNTIIAEAEFSNIKLEKGSIATSWSPAPSDSIYPASYLTTVYDISGYKNHGTVVGSLTAAAGSPRYKTCTVNNDTSYITCPQLFGEVQTISFWLKSDKSNGCFIIEPNSKLGFCISNNLLVISKWVQLTYDATSFISNEWNHIVLVKTGESTALLYINGVEITARGSNINNIAHTMSVPWLFWRSYNENYHGVGSMSDLRIYATALSADDVAELYALGSA